MLNSAGEQDSLSTCFCILMKRADHRQQKEIGLFYTNARIKTGKFQSSKLHQHTNISCIVIVYFSRNLIMCIWGWIYSLVFGLIVGWVLRTAMSANRCASEMPDAFITREPDDTIDMLWIDDYLPGESTQDGRRFRLVLRRYGSPSRILGPPIHSSTAYIIRKSNIGPRWRA